VCVCVCVCVGGGVPVCRSEQCTERNDAVYEHLHAKSITSLVRLA
jgi:carbamate kinase